MLSHNLLRLCLPKLHNLWMTLILLCTFVACNPNKEEEHQITISSLSQTSGPSVGGDTIVITGAGFTYIEDVLFGSETCTDLVVVSTTQIRCVIPPQAAGTVSVVVRGVANRTASTSYTYTSTSPSITSFLPTSGNTVNSLPLTINGTGFLPGATVTVGGVSCSYVNYVNSSKLTCLLAAQPEGDYAIVVTNVDGLTTTAASTLAIRLTPVLSSISTSSSPLSGGGSLTLTGSYFSTGATVKIGTTNCPTTSVSASSIVCTIPAGTAGTYSVTVTNSNTMTSSLSNAFTYRAAPTVTSISPSAGALNGGGTVVITGTGFYTGVTATIGGLTCSNPLFITTSMMSCKVPANLAGSYNVVVKNADNQIGTLTNGYTYKAPPTVTSVSPTSGPLAGGGTLTITGTGFDNTGASVTIGGTACTSLTWLSATSMTCVLPAKSAGSYSVVVTNADAQTGNLASAYTYLPAPTVTAVSPSASGPAGGGTLSLTGTDFVSGATVSIGGTNCAASFVNSTSLTCVLPAKAVGSYTLTVTNPDGQVATLATQYPYQAAPTISSVSPTGGALAGGGVLTVTGTGFLSGVTIAVGGTTCTSPTVVSPTSMTCTLPAKTAGVYDVAVTNSVTGGTNTLATAYTYRVAPTVTTVSPVSGSIAGGGTLTVTGTDFLSGATISIGGTPCTSPTYVSATSLTCTIPANTAGVYSVTVTNPDGQTGTKTNAYTYLGAVPTVTSVTSNIGSTAGGTTVVVAGTNFQNGATIDFGGSACTGVIFTSTTSLTCTTTAHAAGAVTVTVTNPDTQSGNLATAFTYVTPATITNVSPSIGPIGGGTSVTITGTNFVSVANVQINGINCASYTVVSATQITCVTPLSVVSGPVSASVILTGSITTTLATAFVYLQAPTVTSVSPTGGPLAGGTTITINGTGFFMGATATVGGTACTSPTVLSPTSMTCTLPAKTAGAYSVVVTNPDTQTGTLASAYTYRDAPTVVSVSPASGPLAGGTAVTITGTGFVTGATVTIGGSACASPNVTSATTVTCFTPVKSAGSYGITVTNSDSQSGSVSGVYTYQAAPTVTSISPNSGALAGGTAVTITGTGFLTGASVSIGGAACSSLIVVSPTSITCNTPARTAGTYSVVATNIDGQSGTLASAYTYRAAPTVTSVSPTVGPLAGGGTLSITGTGFLSGATVTVGGVACTSPTWNSSTSMSCVLPANTAGSYTVAVTNTDTQVGTLASAYTYRAAPTVSSVSPTAGSMAGGTSITITGTGFAAGAVVTIDGTSCTGVTVSSATSITCTTVAKAAGTYGITVTNSESQSGTLASAYTYRAAPTVTSISPTGGPLAGGTTVTIVGTGFLSGATVSLGGASCTGVSILSPFMLTCTTSAAAAATVSATVTNTDAQSGTLASAYTYRAAPTVTAISVASGPQAGGTAVTITGTGFLSGAIPRFGGVACTSIVFTSSTSISCNTPSTTTAGAVTVSVLNPDGQIGILGSNYTYTAIPILAFQVGTSSPTPPNPDNYGSTTTNITHTFTLKNTGEGTSSTISTSLSGTNPAAFFFGTDNCSGNTLAPGASCTIQLTFLGAFMTSGSYSATLNATATSGGTSTNNVSGSVP